MLTMQTAQHHAIAAASETAGSLVFRPRERPPTQLHQAASRLQRCAPSRLSTISGAAEPKSLSRLLPDNGEMEPTKIAPSSPCHCTFTRVRANHSSPEATPKPLFLLCTCSVSAKISSEDTRPLSSSAMVIMAIRKSSHSDALRTYHSSNFSFSSLVTSLAPWTWAHPLIPGRTKSLIDVFAG